MISRAIRIYDKNEKNMMYPKEGTDNGVFLGMDGYPLQFDGKQFYKLDACVVMFETGLMDAYAKPIWEADICEVDVPIDFGGMTSFVKARGVMAWNKPVGKWFLKMATKPMGGVGDFQVMNARVIGNIYQHKYLLQDGKGN